MKPNTNTDEERLKALVGTENPFRVPEGYFQSFQQQLMQSLPQQPAAAERPARPSFWSKVHPWVAVAALFCGVILLLTTTMRQADEASVLAADSSMAYDEDEMSDYMVTSLFDEYTLYSYLTEEEY